MAVELELVVVAYSPPEAAASHVGGVAVASVPPLVSTVPAAPKATPDSTSLLLVYKDLLAPTVAAVPNVGSLVAPADVSTVPAAPRVKPVTFPVELEKYTWLAVPSNIVGSICEIVALLVVLESSVSEIRILSSPARAAAAEVAALTLTSTASADATIALPSPTSSVTSPVKPPPVKPSPAVTPVMSPDVLETVCVPVLSSQCKAFVAVLYHISPTTRVAGSPATLLAMLNLSLASTVVPVIGASPAFNTP